MRRAEEPMMDLVARLIGYLVMVFGGLVALIKSLEWLVGL